jgi:hypothetical protein
MIELLAIVRQHDLAARAGAHYNVTICRKQIITIAREPRQS